MAKPSCTTTDLAQTLKSASRRFNPQPFGRLIPALALACVSVAMIAAARRGMAKASLSDDQKAVAELDTRFQAAVKKNDVAEIDRLLADDFALVVGSGKTYTKSDLLEEARSGRMQYEIQDDTDQTVRVWGDAAVITAKLREKGMNDGKAFDYTVWFSDTYVRTPSGWRYVFAQSSLPLPNAPQNQEKQ